MNPTVIIKKIDESYIEIVTDERWILLELSEHFSFKVPGAKFQPLVRSGFWDGVIKLFNLNTNKILSGLLPDIEFWLTEHKVEYTVNFCEEIETRNYDAITESLNFNFEIRDYQYQNINTSLNEKRKLILSPTGSGKSVTIYSIIRELVNKNKKILLLVPTVSLVSQMEHDFKDYSENNGWDVSEFCHTIFAGQEKETEKDVAISTWQSIFKLPKKYFKRYDVIICDEVHLATAKSIQEIVSSCINAEYKIGFTGTLKDTKCDIMVLRGLFGSVEELTSTSKLIEDNILADINIATLQLKYPKHAIKDFVSKGKKYPDEIDFIIEYEERNIFLRKLALHLTGNSLFLFTRVDSHAKKVYNSIKDILENDPNISRKVSLVVGEVSKKKREEIRLSVEDDTNHIIIASCGVFSTGINIKNINNIVFASPIKSKIRVMQSIGRGLRRSDTKDNVVLYDLVDDLCYGSYKNFAYKHYEERLIYYASERLPCINKVLNLK